MPAADHPTMQLQADVGQPLPILLDAAPGSGLLWQPPQPPAGCSLSVGERTAAGAGDGSAVQQCFVFTADSAGARTLRFELRRDWEAKAQAVQVVKVRVA